MTDGVNAVKNIKPKTQSPYCFICNSKIGVSSRNFLQLFGDKPHLINDTPLAVILSSLIHRDIAEDSTHSQIVCKKCNKLCVEYDELENRLNEIRTEVIQNYNKTIIKHGGRPVDVDTEELLATLETSEDNSSFSQSREDIEIENLSRENSEVIMPEQIEIPQNETILHDGNQKIIIIQNKKSIKNEFVDDNGKNKIQNTEFDDSQESIEDDDTQEHHYFEEVEIITENHEEYNLLNNDEINMNDDQNSIDILENNDSMVEQQHMDINIIKTIGIKLEPEENEMNDNKRQKNVKRIKPEQKIKQEVPDEGEDEEKDTESEQQVLYIRDGENFICQLCPDTLEDEQLQYDTKGIVSHLKKEHNIISHVCDICGANFKKRTELSAHLEDHLQTNQNGEFQCTTCNRIFKNLRLYRIHKRMHYSNVKTFSCEQCHKKFGSNNLLMEHMNMHTGFRPYKCEHCVKDFASKYTLSAHMKIHSERPRPFTCKVCNKSFLSGQNLQQHEKIHTGVKGYICNVCEKAFGTLHNLTVHKIVHSGYKPFICRTCNKAFARRAEIKDHERTHTGERPFVCDICNARFAQKSNLQSHKRVTHFNDKRYKCEDCLRSFKRRRLLEYHIRATHTGERPYKCPHCSSSFVYPEHFKKHVRIHSGDKPYLCEVCNKAFNSRDNRNAHRFVHSDKKPYECLVCGQGFMRKPLLYAHMQQQGHLNDTIVVNQPRITDGEHIVSTDSKREWLKQKHISEDNVDDEGKEIIEEIDYEEERIEEEEELPEENLIIDGQVQFTEDQITDDLNEYANVSSEQIFVSGDEHFIETENGPVQIVQIRLPNSDGKDNMAWVNLVSQ